jgi:hypothetical protein
MNPTIAASLSAFATRFAATADLPFWTPRPPRRMPRSGRPEPRMTRQYTQAMSTLFARDQRLGRAAMVIAPLLVAQAGGGSVANVTRTYLARQLGYSDRTIARGLAELRAAGYIRTEHRIGPIGECLGLRCWLLPPLFPPPRDSQAVAVKVKDSKTQERGLQDGVTAAPSSAPRAPLRRRARRNKLRFR